MPKNNGLAGHAERAAENAFVKASIPAFLALISLMLGALGWFTTDILQDIRKDIGEVVTVAHRNETNIAVERGVNKFQDQRLNGHDSRFGDLERRLTRAPYL